MIKLMGKKIFTCLPLKNCLSKPKFIISERNKISGRSCKLVFLFLNSQNSKELFY